MARTRDEKSFQEKRRHILDIAVQCFIESGFHGTGMAKICKAADMSAGALYRYFPSKEAMIEAIVEQERADTSALLGELEQAENKAVGLAELLEQMVLMLANDRSYCQLAVEISAEASRNPAIADLMSEADADILIAFTHAVQAGQVAGHINPTLSPDVTAHLLMVMLNGWVGHLAVQRDWDAEAIAQHTKHAVLNLLKASCGN